MMGQCEDSDGPAGSTFLQNGFKEAKEGRFGIPEGVNWSALCWRATAAGGELEERGVDVDVSGVGWGVVISGVSMSRIPLAVAKSAEVRGLRRPSIVV